MLEVQSQASHPVGQNFSPSVPASVGQAASPVRPDSTIRASTQSIGAKAKSPSFLTVLWVKFLAIFSLLNCFNWFSKKTVSSQAPLPRPSQTVAAPNQAPISGQAGAASAPLPVQRAAAQPAVVLPVVVQAAVAQPAVAQPATSLIHRTASYSLSPSLFPAHGIVNANKRFVYGQFMQNRTFSEAVNYSRFELRSERETAQMRLFSSPQSQVETCHGPFNYEPSTADVAEWFANFGDSHLFGYSQGPLFAQDEHQTMEHPSLIHLKVALEQQVDLAFLRGCAAVLLPNVEHMGIVDITTPLPNRGEETLYGNNFRNASRVELTANITPLIPPTKSNIYLMVAPHAGPMGQPYQKQSLEQLFYRSFTAFSAIKQQSAHRVSLHIGNWGCGAFGNDVKTSYLIQLAAARAAGIDVVKCHPLSRLAAFANAQTLLGTISQSMPQATADQFLTHLADNAAAYGLLYGRGNGT